MVTGGKAKTTGIIDAFELISGARLLRKNNSFVCLRKGDKDGEELAGGAAGCDTHNKATRAALARVTKLFVHGLRASGLEVVLIIGFSNAAGEALTGDAEFVKTCAHGVVLEGREFLGIDVVLTPHAKYALTPTAVDNDKAACARMGVEHPFRSSRMCQYLAGAFAEAVEHGASKYDFSAVGDVPEYIYERVREDKNALKAGIFAVPWDERDDGKMSDEALAALKAAIAAPSEWWTCGGRGMRLAVRAARVCPPMPSLPAVYRCTMCDCAYAADCTCSDDHAHVSRASALGEWATWRRQPGGP